MTINQYLRSIGKTKSELAREIGLSRPTLNQYIEFYETGQRIENERYDIIFKRLFSGRPADRDLFERRILSIKNLIERDKKYDIGCLEPEAADLVARIHNNMVSDMSNGEWDRKVYDTILIFLSRYREYPIIRELAGYFSDLNSDSEILELTEESKAYYAYYYKCFREIRDKRPEYDPDIYNDFLARKEQLKKERKERNRALDKKVQKRLERVINDIMLEFQQNGIDATEDEIMKEMARRMGGMGDE